MSKVSTRPQKVATPVTAAVTDVAGASPSEQPDTLPEKWRTAAIDARDAVSKLVFDANILDEEERSDSNGMAKRLMALVVADLGETSTEVEKDEFEGAFFNAEALIHGALNIPGDTVGLKAERNLRHALVIIDKMTDLLRGGFDVHMVLDAIRCTPKPSASVRNVVAPSGFNAKQLGLILETIAGNTQTLTQMLMLLQNNSIEDEFAQGVCIDAAKNLATAIGAMADDAIGGCVIGDAACWHFGPNFANMGKAVQA